jgi:hypothetical protein
MFHGVSHQSSMLLSAKNKTFLLVNWCDALSLSLFNFALEYAIRRIQANHEHMKLNGTHQLLVYVHDVNILDQSIHTIRKNTKALETASKEISLKVNVEKTKYMVMSRDHNAGQNGNTQISNKLKLWNS